MADRRYVIVGKAGYGQYYRAAKDDSFDGMVQGLRDWVTRHAASIG